MGGVEADPIKLVLDALDWMWRCDGPPRPDQTPSVGAANEDPWGEDIPLGLAIQRFGEVKWKELPVQTRAEHLRTWLKAIVGYLEDAESNKLRWRFRRAWEANPAPLLLAPLTAHTIRLTIERINTDIRVADRIEESHGSAIHGLEEQLAAVIAPYEMRRPLDDAWACLVEAVRVGAEELPTIQKLLSDADVSVDAAPFALVVYDSLCPGRARELVGQENGLSSLRECIKLWRQTRDDQKLSRAQLKGTREQLWDLLRIVTRRGGDVESMRRRWAKIETRFRLDSTVLEKSILNMNYDEHAKTVACRPLSGGTRIDFAPKATEDRWWVEPLLHGVRSAIPQDLKSQPAVKSLTALAALMFTDEFLKEADELLPTPIHGKRGPRPMSNREALTGIVTKFHLGRGWKEIPNGSVLHQRWQFWCERGVQFQLAQLLFDFGILNGDELRRLQQ